MKYKRKKDRRLERREKHTKKKQRKIILWVVQRIFKKINERELKSEGNM